MMSILRKYRAYILLEKGLSENTRKAYASDVEKLLDFLADEGIDVRSCTLDDLHRFAASLHDIGISAVSVARILCGVRSFFTFLLQDGYIEADPTELLESPKKPEHLPAVLTLQEVDALEAAIDQSLPEGRRDHAMIEVLYSCGLRVSELCGLQLSDLFLDEGFLRVTGKGNKQRLAQGRGRTEKMDGRAAAHRHPSRRGGLCVCEPPPGAAPLAHHGVPQPAGLRPAGRYRKEHLAPHAAPHLCHPPAGGRGQPARHPGDARP